VSFAAVTLFVASQGVFIVACFQLSPETSGYTLGMMALAFQVHFVVFAVT
jgi:hypothetical protein